ncbi:MAG: citramalate synthase [Rhodospirillales bacterium]|nr:citramalate synthase [Rhodospirillales bacterium]
MSDKRVYLYDCTLRDGAQTQGVDFNAADKEAIAHELDRLGVDYIEGGWPGANPTDDAFFANPPKLKKSILTSFGMTRRAGRSSSNDPGLQAILTANVDTVCMVGKTWDFHVDVALDIEHDENISMIADSTRQALKQVKEVIFDAEHFFDGYKANPEFALNCIKAAFEAGARWIVLCDTNGGTLPHEIEEIVTEITQHIPGENLGIHCHDDTGNAVANSLAAVRAGCRQVQGTLNGLGERCGNANLITIIPSLMLKMGFETGIKKEELSHLAHISHSFDERLNRAPNRSAPYVGESAFAHKGGLHVSAVEKDPASYEHINPETVGNFRHIVVSDQSGRANILASFREIGLEIDPKDPKVDRVVEIVKEMEFEGYSYDGADASFELLARRALGEVPDYFHCSSFRVIDERRWNAKGELITLSEATVKMLAGDRESMAVAEGNGPVNALDAALRQVLTPLYPELADLRLVDFKVRILTPTEGTRAVTRVIIESADKNGTVWSTVGVSANIIDASYNALRDSIIYKLFRDGATVVPVPGAQ